MPDKDKKNEQAPSDEFERFDEGMRALFAIPPDEARKIVDEAKKVEGAKTNPPSSKKENDG